MDRPSELRLLPAMARSVRDGFVLTDPEGLVTWVNPGFEALCGYSLKDLLGRKPGTVLQGPGSDPEAIAAMGRAVREGKAVTRQILNYHREGSPYFASIHIAPVRAPSGELVRFAGIARRVPFMEALVRAETSLEAMRDFLRSGFPPELLVPICAWCKRVRDPEGGWRPIEEYLYAAHHQICSHSICPWCEAAGRGEREEEEDSNEAPPSGPADAGAGAET